MSIDNEDAMLLMATARARSVSVLTSDMWALLTPDSPEMFLPLKT